MADIFRDSKHSTALETAIRVDASNPSSTLTKSPCFTLWPIVRSFVSRDRTFLQSDPIHVRQFRQAFGFLKALVSQSDDQILGFTMIGPDAGEVMSVVQTAMLAGLPYTALRDAILTHPTMAEGLNTLFGAVK